MKKYEAAQILLLQYLQQAFTRQACEKIDFKHYCIEILSVVFNQKNIPSLKCETVEFLFIHSLTHTEFKQVTKKREKKYNKDNPADILAQNCAKHNEKCHQK